MAGRVLVGSKSAAFRSALDLQHSTPSGFSGVPPPLVLKCHLVEMRLPFGEGGGGVCVPLLSQTPQRFPRVARCTALMLI